MNEESRQQTSLRPRYLAVVLMVAVITLLHYNTAVHIHEAHGIYRRLYYFPIILAAFLGGMRAGVMTAVFICLVYIPHAFGLIGFDPAPTLEKILEMILYVAVGLVTGVLVSRESAARFSLRQTADGLRTALAEKARMEDELVRAARLAAVGRLSAGLAHEIRNPLASIKGAAEVLADDIPADTAKGRLLQVLVDESGRLNGVLTRFLAFARPHSGDQEDVDLAAEVTQVIDLVRHHDDATAVRITTPSFPNGALPIRADREQLGQLLLNVLLNGVQAAGPEGEVTVSLTMKNERVCCRVADSGPGFSEEALANLGTPFYTTRTGGTGLGLAICFRIVEELGGSIVVRNRSAGGAEVRLEFPVPGEGS